MPELHTATWTPYRFQDGRIVRAGEAEWQLLEACERHFDFDGEEQVVKLGMDLFRDEDWPVVLANDVQVWKRSQHGGFTTSDHYRDTVAATLTDLRRDVFRRIDGCPDVRFVAETENVGDVDNLWEYPEGATIEKIACHPNITLAVAVSNQQQADEQLPELINCRDLCGDQWVYYDGSERVDWNLASGDDGSHIRDMRSIDAIIIRASDRPMDLFRVGYTVQQCREAGVRCWIESLGIDERDWPADLLAVNERWVTT